MSHSTLKRKSSDDCPIPTKISSSRYPLGFVFPNGESQRMFVNRGKKKSQRTAYNGPVIISYSGLKVVVSSPVATKSSLDTAFTALRRYLCRDADVVIFNPALINRALEATPGTCHRLELSERTTDQVDILRSLFPHFQIDSFLRSGKYRMLSCSSWAKGKATGDGLVRFLIDPQSYECFVEDNWALHLSAVCIGNTETINSADVFRKAFDHSNSYLVTGAYEVLKRLEVSRGNVSKAIHLASDIVVPESMLTSRDQQNPGQILPFPRNIEALERNQKLVSDFFHQCIQPRLIGMAKIKEFAVLLFDGNETKYDECFQLLEPTDGSGELLYQIYIQYRSMAGNAIDFSTLKDVFKRMKHKELSDLCDEFYIEHSFVFKIH